jgi:hypothetical protein
MVAWHSTDNLMLSRRQVQFFYHLMGISTARAYWGVAHPLFTNTVWREGEFNFFKERNKRGMRGVLTEMNRQWDEMGFGNRAPDGDEPQ